ncbi:hypothetical protein ACFU8W_30845 [Streptomyces sp. NPDC057565]|uniref:hypothetical protein n=1 Tax=Streptomyces sp. NPDC057565 TaxID=3346169 RepID=UPI0036ACE1A3
MAERGRAGNVLVQDVVLPLIGRQRLKMGDCRAQMAGGPQHGGVQDQTERVELVLPPLAVRLHDLTALPWQMSRASLCRDFWTVSCQLIRGRKLPSTGSTTRRR